MRENSSLRRKTMVRTGVSAELCEVGPHWIPADGDLGLASAVWRDRDIPPQRRRRPGWEPIPVRPGQPVWTDDYANLLGVFSGW